ncbi:hypothetical protein JOC95_002896 [Bacillus tianshenii]|uniref:Uncharacterized protein n=1 Tax=Sutcliffiella tianshenii TaxID=1463404 RepID=A0ABS2P2T1_9BACI|nr:hypothetical protein [Bacillus tianshenii]MBM7621023.1 hypothetical protein [Bacillus tianshenii]
MNILIPLLLMSMIIPIVILIKKPIFAKSSTRSMNLLTGYIALLLVATAVFYLLPNKKYQPVESIPVADESWEKLYEDLLEKREVDQKHVRSKTSYSIEEKDLQLAVTSPDYYVSIIVERDGSLENRVEATLYASYLAVNGFDLSNEIPTPTLKLQNGTLTIMQPSKLEVELNLIKKEFVYSQFSKESWLEDDRFGSTHSAPILYLKVPEDIKISTLEGLYYDEVK